jgi:hypothetical protein
MTQQLSSGVAKNIRAATVGIPNNPDISRGPPPPGALLPPPHHRGENTARQEGIINRDTARHSSSTKDAVYCPEYSQSPPEAKTLLRIETLLTTSITMETDTEILVTIKWEPCYLLRNHPKDFVKKINKKAHLSLYSK